LPSITLAPSPGRIREGANRAGSVGHSATATLKILQQRGEMFRNGVVDRVVPGPEPLPDFPQPWALAQDLATFGSARPTLPELLITD